MTVYVLAKDYRQFKWIKNNVQIKDQETKHIFDIETLRDINANEEPVFAIVNQARARHDYNHCVGFMMDCFPKAQVIRLET